MNVWSGLTVTLVVASAYEGMFVVNVDGFMIDVVDGGWVMLSYFMLNLYESVLEICG